MDCVADLTGCFTALQTSSSANQAVLNDNLLVIHTDLKFLAGLVVIFLILMIVRWISNIFFGHLL